MKLILLGIAASLALVACKIDTTDQKSQSKLLEKWANYLDEGTPANVTLGIDTEVDSVIKMLHEYLCASKEEVPVELISKKFSRPYVLGEYLLEAELTNGVITEFPNLVRNGPSFLKLTNSATFEIPLLIEFVSFDFDYAATVLDHKPRGVLVGNVTNMEFNIVLTSEDEYLRLRLVKFELANVGDVVVSMEPENTVVEFVQVILKQIFEEDISEDIIDHLRSAIQESFMNSLALLNQVMATNEIQ